MSTDKTERNLNSSVSIGAPSVAKRCSVLLCCIAVGCAAIGAKRSTTHPATTQASAAPRTLHLSDAVPIVRFRTGDRDVDLRNRITYDGGRDLYFGQVDTVNGDGETSATLPVVVGLIKGGWVALSLEDPRLKNAEWQFVASGPAEKEIWGVLDDSLNHKGKVLLLAHSTDAGQTWSVASVEKPFGAGDYDSFAMDRNGHGRLSIYVAPDDKHPRRAGFYHLHTTDAAKTWSAPDHEADALDPAEEVPADEDIPPLKEAPTQSARLDKIP